MKTNKNITIEESKIIMLNILKSVHKFCVDNNLKYSLYAGTLIGAIRHNGFIPWDDDIDIVMPRKDYQFFIKNFKTQFYNIITPYNSKEYYLPWAKVFDNRTIKIEPMNIKSKYLFGVDIDVFPVDFVDSEDSYLIVQKMKKNLNSKRNRALSKASIPNPVVHPKAFCNCLITRFFYSGKQTKFCRKLDKSYQKFNNNDHNFLMVNSLFFKRPIFKNDLFDNLILHDFEKEKFYVFSEYDYFLKLMFGDYMKLPPVEKQQTHHSNMQFYK